MSNRREHAQRPAIRTAFGVALALAVVAPGIGTQASAEECATAAFASVAQRLQPAQVPNFAANVQVHARLRGFPFVGMTFGGTSSYGSNGYTLSLDRAPRGADQFETLAHFLIDQVMSSAEWSNYVATPTRIAPGTLGVHMVPKQQSPDVKALDLTIDEASARVTKGVFTREDGTITLVQHFGSVQGRDVVMHQDISLSLSRVRAEIAAEYNNIDVTTVVAGR